MTFPEYGTGTNCNTRSSIGAPEIVRHDVKHTCIILKFEKFYAPIDEYGV